MGASVRMAGRVGTGAAGKSLGAILDAARTDILVVNRVEAKDMAGFDDPELCANALFIEYAAMWS